MKFPFTIAVRIEAEVESVVPDDHGNIEATLSLGARKAKCCYDAAGDDHGTLQDALLSLLGYRRDEAAWQEHWQPAARASSVPQRVM